MKRLLIDLAAPPFCGHLHPILGMARRLSRDHEVRLLTTERGLARAGGLELDGVALLRGRDEDIARIVAGAGPARSNPVALHAQLRANLQLMGQFQAETAALYRSRPPDLLIADLTLPVLGPVAQACGVPWWTSHPSPCVIEPLHGAGVPAYLGGLAPREGLIGGCRDRLGHGMTQFFKRSVHALHRRELTALGFPRVYRPDGTEAVYSPERILGLAWPDLEFPRRWPSAVRLVGPVLYTPPTPELTLPFVSGKRHVLVTLGTHSDWLKDRAAEAVRQAAAALPEVIFHFSDGQPDTRGASEVGRGNFRRLAYVPYDRYLARYDLVVHHGGAGVLHRCLEQGKPAVVFPVDFDQFDYAARLIHTGLAKRLPTLPALGETVAAALADEPLRQRCEAFRRVVIAKPPAEERIAAMVRARLGQAKSQTAENRQKHWSRCAALICHRARPS